MRKISVVFLEEVFKRIVDKLEFEAEDGIEINTDSYLNIPASEWCTYDHGVSHESLFDDIDGLELLVGDKERPCTCVDLDRIASVLGTISYLKSG